MAKTYLGSKLQDLGHIETVVPDDKIVIVKEKDEGVLSLSEFFFYVKENLDFSNYVTIKDARETYARRDSVYTKDVSDAKYAFIDRVYTRTVSDSKYSLKDSTYSKEYIDTSFTLRDEVYTRDNTYSKQEAFTIFALKTDIPILPDLRPYTTTVDGDKRWANISQSYTKVQSDGLFALKGNTYTKLETDDLYATKANTFTKDESEVRYLNVEEGYNRTYIDSNFYYKPDLYTRDESNTRFPRRDEVYTIAAVNDQFAAKSWVYSRAEALTTFPLITKTYTKTEVNTLLETRAAQTENELRTGYYSKINADTKFANKTDVYTKLEADNQYAPRGTSLTEAVIRQDYYMRDVIDAKFAAIDFTPYLRTVNAAATYAPKTLVYTKAESDGKYLIASNPIINITGTGTGAYSTGVVFDNTSSSVYSGSLTWKNKGVVSTYLSVFDNANGTSQLKLFIKDNEGATGSTVAFDYASIWHKAYGYLHDYFAKASDSYKRGEIDTKLATAASLVYPKAYIDSTLYTRSQVDSSITALDTSLKAAIVAHAYTKAQSDAKYATKVELVAGYALKSNVYTKVEADAKYVPIVRYEEDLAVISNDNYLGLVLNGHAKKSGRVGVSNLQAVTNASGERIIELIDISREAVLATNIKPRLDSKLVLNALARYKNNPAINPSLRIAFRYFDESGTELKTVNLPDSTKTYTLSRNLTVGDTLLFTNSFDAIKNLRTAPAFIMGSDLSLRKVSNIIAFPPSGTSNWWDGVNQVSQGSTATEAQAILKAPWNTPNPARQDGVWPAGTVISIPANTSEADANAPLLYYTVNATGITGIPWARINERFNGLTNAITVDGTRSYFAYETLKVQVSIIPQNNALEFVTLSLEHLSQTDFESLKNQYFTKTEVNTDFIRKSDYANYAYTKAQVYTKAESDANYYRKADTYTRTEINAQNTAQDSVVAANKTDANSQLTAIRTAYLSNTAAANTYQTIAATATLKSQLEGYADTVGSTVTSNVARDYYSKVEAEARYYNVNQPMLNVNGSTTSIYGSGAVLNNNMAGSNISSSLIWKNEGVRSGMFHTVGSSNAYTTMHLYLKDSDTTWTSHLYVNYASIWHKKYGHLHDYFAIANDTYAKNEVYTKADVYTKTEANNLYIPKSITTLSLPKFEVGYTTAGLASQTAFGYVFNMPDNTITIRPSTSTAMGLAVSYIATTGGKFFSVGVDGSIYSNGVNIADIYAAKVDTYKKSEVDTALSTLKADTMGVAELTQKFNGIYTKSEVYSKTESEARYTNVGVSYTKAETDVRYYTKALADARYEYIGVAYTKAQSDANYYSKSAADSTFATKTDTYTKAQIDAFNTTQNTALGLRYTKVETDAKFYDMTQSDARYYQKSDVYVKGDLYTKTQIDAAFYTKSVADARYEYMGVAYTKAQTDAKFYDATQSDARYHQKTVTYTRTESDSRYLLGTGVQEISASTTSVYSLGMIFRNNHATSNQQGGIQWYNKTVRTGLVYVMEPNADDSLSRLMVVLNNPSTAGNANTAHIDYNGMWHRAYGNLHEYFMTATDVYKKAEVYTKAESEARYTNVGVSYTKAESEARYTNVGVSYTKAESEARYYTKALADARYEYIGVAYTKAQSDDKYLIALGLPEISNSTTNTYSLGLVLRNNHATATTQGGIQWFNKTIRTALIYVYEPTSADKSSRMGIYLNDPASGGNVTTAWIDYSGMWHKAYGNLHEYFAKSSEYYSKVETDARFYDMGQANARFEYMGVAYTKAQSDARYVIDGTSMQLGTTSLSLRLMATTGTAYIDMYANNIKEGVIYANSAAFNFNWGTYGTVLKLRHDGIWHQAYGNLHDYFAKSAEYYSKTESDGRYYTKAQGDARYEYMGVAYTKAQSDAKYLIETDPLQTIRGSSSTAYAHGLTFEQTGTGSYGGFLNFKNQGVMSAAWYSSGGSTTFSQMNLNLRDTNAAFAAAFNITSLRIWHKTYGYLDDYFAKSAEYYSKVETDARFYDTTQANARFALKTDSYTKSESESRYTNVGVSYTKAESDGRYPTKTASYTRAEGDARYVNYTDQLVKFTGNQTDTYKLGLEVNNDHATTDAGSSILWNIRGVRSAMWYVTGGSVTASQMNLYLRHTDAVWQSAFNVTTSRMWHKTYGYLDTYFAKSSEYYSKVETDARFYDMGQANARFALKTDSYTKSESEARYTNVGVSYTKAETDAKYEPINTMYTKAESDARYEPINTMYTKAESDGRYVNTNSHAVVTSVTAGSGAPRIAFKLLTGKITNDGSSWNIVATHGLTAANIISVTGTATSTTNETVALTSGIDILSTTIAVYLGGFSPYNTSSPFKLFVVYTV